jgi:hypothetical protein
MKGELTPARKAQIDNMTLEDLLRHWRFAPVGAFEMGDPTSDYFANRMYELKSEQPGAWTAASKRLGW